MPRKPSKPRRTGGESWKDNLHTVDFSLEEEMDIQAWESKTKPSPWFLLQELVDDGWSIRITPPKNGDDYWCTGTAKSVEKSLDGHSFSVRYPDMETTIILLGYVIKVQLEDGQLDQIITPKSRDWLSRSP